MSVKSELVELFDNPPDYPGTAQDLLLDAGLMVSELKDYRIEISRYEAAAMISQLAAVVDEVVGIAKESS